MFYTKDGLYDCAWSEENEFHLVSVSGDGSIKLWDVTNKEGRPLRAWQEHNLEVSGVDWNLQVHLELALDLRLEERFLCHFFMGQVREALVSNATSLLENVA
jgi:WD40 repeat protein